jgi:hypothetical protein
LESVYGKAVLELRACCAERHVTLHEFKWQKAMEGAGLQRDALYLVRPDGYVGFAAADQSVATLCIYLDAHGIRLLP